MIKTQAWIFLTVGLGLSLLVGVIVTILILCILSRRNKRRERRGIVGNAALVAALQQSFANQTQFLTNTFQIDQGGGGETECLTCSLIQMGSSMAYGDNSCPQCGAKCDV